MKITSSAIVNGVIQDKYGKRGQVFKNKLGEIKQEFDHGYMPTNSIPIRIEAAPENTVSNYHINNEQHLIFKRHWKLGAVHFLIAPNI